MQPKHHGLRVGGETQAMGSTRSWIDAAARPRILAVAAFLIGAAVVMADRPFTHPESGDSSIFDYIAQSIVRGQVPYRDVIDPKGPGSTYLSAAAMVAGVEVGMRDIIAVRWLHVLMMGLLAATTFLVGEAYFQSRLASVLAFLVPLVSSGFTSQVIRGTQPKLSMVLFGVLSVLLIARDKPFWAGFFSMLSCLCWQPGLMFTGTAVLIFSRYFTSWRDLRAARVLAGAIVPLAVVVLYFYSKGALTDLWSWTIVYPFTVFAPETSMPVGETLENFWLVIHNALAPLPIVGPLSLAGLIWYAVVRIRRRIKSGRETKCEELFKDAVAFPPAIYLVFCIINFQSAPDLIPFYPFFGLFTGWLVVRASRLVGRSSRVAQRWIPLGAIGVAVVMILIEHAASSPRDTTLQDQDREARVLASYLGPGDRIYAHGMGEVLVLLRTPNLNKYLAFNSGADNFIAAKKPGGFQDVIQEIESQEPKIVVMTRLRNVRHREEIQQWMSEHYDKLKLESLRGVYIRRQ